jgi:hypothetical protein
MCTGGVRTGEVLGRLQAGDAGCTHGRCREYIQAGLAVTACHHGHSTCWLHVLVECGVNSRKAAAARNAPVHCLGRGATWRGG